MFNQQASVDKLKREIEKVMAERFPLVLHGGYEIIAENIRFTEPASDLDAQTKAFVNETTLEMPVKTDLVVKKDGEVLFNRKQITFTRVPYPTERGSYIVNGNENVMINQMVLRSGVYVGQPKILDKKQVLKSEVRAGRTRFEIVFNKTDGRLDIEGLSLQFGQNPGKISALAFLHLIGATDEEVKAAIGNDAAFELIKKNTKMTPQKVFEKMFTQEYDESAGDYTNEQLSKRLPFDEKTNKVTKAVINHEAPHFDKGTFLATIRQMFKELEQPNSTPNIDDIRFKNIYGPEEIIARAVNEGINAWQGKIINDIRFGKVNKDSIHPAKVMNKEIKGLYGSTLFEHVSSGNALDLYQNQQKITFGGPGGINIDSVSNAARSLRDNSFTKIDPVETPQSLNLGYTQHLSKDVKIENNTLYSAYYRVKNGEVDRSSIVQDIDPVDEYDEVIAFHTPAQIDKAATPWKLKGETIRARHKGDFVDVKASEVTLIDKSPTSHIGNATALVPFAAHNDGSRMLMGATMQRQALPLNDPDEPLVQSIEDEDTQMTLEERLANESSYLLKAPLNGKVSAIEDEFIEITGTDGKRVQVKKLNYHATGTSGGFINHNPVVKVGDEVREGELLADGWQSKNGKLALGKNTRVAYMPYKGYNFEDGVVVSESFAEKMSSEELEIVKEEIIYTDMTVPKNEVKKRLQELMVSTGVLSKLDKDGVIKKGQEITRGDILIGIVRKKEKDHLSAAEKILNRVLIESARESFVNDSVKVEGYTRGRVIDVEKVDLGDSMRVMLKILSHKPMGIGDKLAGRHGNKGTITKILPDGEMPQTEDGKPVELIFSPLAVPSRKNVGQLLEVNAGLVAEKKGMKSYNIQNFNHTEREKLMKELEEIGAPDGKTTLIDPTTGKAFENPVTVGPMYVMKLKHKVEGKISGRNYVGAVDKVTDMPKKVSGATDGERNSPQSIGGMEFWSLTSAGAVHNIHEMTTIKSDGAGTDHDGSLKFKIYEALKEGRPLPEPATPQTLKVLQEQLYGAGIAVTPLKNNGATTLDEQFNALMLSPMKKSQLEKLSPTTVEEAKTFNAYSKTRDKKGLYGEKVFGKDGDQWGKIETNTPLANPLFLSDDSSRPYEALLSSKGIRQKDIVDVVKNGRYIVLDPKDSGFEKFQVLTPEEVEEAEIIDDKEFTVATGSSALHALLQDVDLKAELQHNEEQIRALDGKETNTALEDRSRHLKNIKILGSAIDNDMQATDYMMPFVPVLPVKYREPVQTGGDNGLAEDGITLLYQQFMKQNDELKNALDKNEGNADLLDRNLYAKLEQERMKTLENIIGAGQPYKDKSRNIEYKGIMHRLSSKEGFIRDKMQKKRQDYSGRSVIIGAPELALDDVRLPEDMAADIFRPKIEGEMVRRKMNREQINEAFKTRNEDFRNALQQVAENEVVILNRAPSLHRHSLQAFKPQIGWNAEGKKNLAIGLNPLVTTGFNADFDGDCLLNSVFVRYQEVGIKTSNDEYINHQGDDEMPLGAKENIRYRYGLVNMQDFPRGELLEVKGNKEIYSVPEHVEILTVWNNEKKWLPVESYSVHKDLNMLHVVTNTSRSIQVSDDHSLVTVDEELNYKRGPAEKGMTLPRLREAVNSVEYELQQEVELPAYQESKYEFPDTLPLDLNLGYFFGAYIGDGWVSTNPESPKKNYIYLADQKGQVTNRVKEIIQGMMRNETELLISSVDAPHIFEGKESFCVKRTWTSSRFAMMLRQHIGSKAENKHLPEFWMQSPVEFRWGLLSGLIDTDGSVGFSKKGKQLNVNFTTISRTLAYEIVGLAHSLNLTASVTPTKTPKGRECFAITFTQESIEGMRKRLWLANAEKTKRLEEFRLNKDGKRNKYTPKLTNERLKELRKTLGSPRLHNRQGELIVQSEKVELIKKFKSLYQIVYRVEKQNTAITRQTALDIFNLVPEFFEKDEFWSKWKGLVLDETIEWELVTDISPIPFITEAYDLTVPPNYTMVTESGIVVYDTMSVHLPVSEAAKREAVEKLMPSKNILNPTSNSIITELKHEMILGIYYMTRDRMPTLPYKEFKDLKTLKRAYDKGEVTTYDGVRVSIPQKGMVMTTAGKALFNAPLPAAFMDFEKNVNMKKKSLEAILMDIIEDPKYGPMRAVQVMNAWKDIGFNAATKSAVSIGVKDFDAVSSINKDQLFAEAEKAPSVAKYIDNRDEFETEKSKFVAGRIKKMIEEDRILGEDNPIEIMRASGARGNAGQIQSMGVFVGHGKKVDETAIRPVKASLIEGLTPDQFWDLSNDSRKGIYDRSVATQKPGELTRQLWMSNKHTVITMKDCKDAQGIVLNMGVEYENKGLYGRVLLKDVSLKEGKGIIRATGKPLTRKEVEQIRKYAQTPERIQVRSPLSCKAKEGLCQLCYGLKPGSLANELAPIGEPVGSIAAQAIGEPSQQAIMKTFHVGSGQNSVGSGFTMIRDAVMVSGNESTAILAKSDGRVSRVEHNPITGWKVTIGRNNYALGTKPKHPDIVEGAVVKAGDPLTDLSSTQLSTQDVLKYKGPDAAKAHLTSQLTTAFEAGGTDFVDRRHAEVVVNNIADHAVVDAGHGSNFLSGQQTTLKTVQHHNAQKEIDASLSYVNRLNVIGAKAARDYHTMGGRTIVKKGDVITESAWNELNGSRRKSVKIVAEQIQFTPSLSSVRHGTRKSNTNWLDAAAYDNVKREVTQGALNHHVDQLNTPLTRQMSGLKGNFGEGFNDFLSDMKSRFPDFIG